MAKTLNTRIIRVGKNDPTADYNTANYADDSACLQAAINSVAVGKRVDIKLSADDFIMVRTINYRSNMNLSGRGRATRLIQTANFTQKLANISNVTIKNLLVECSGMFDTAIPTPPRTFTGNVFGIYCENVINVRLQGIRIQDAVGFGIFVTAGGVIGIPLSDNVQITDCYLNGLGISDVIGGGPARNTANVKNCVVRNCTVIQDATQGNFHKDAINFVAVDNVVFSDNTTYGSILYGSEESPHQRSRISRNTVYPALGNLRSAVGLIVGNVNPNNLVAGGTITIDNNIIMDGFINLYNNLSANKMTYVIVTNNDIQSLTLISSNNENSILAVNLNHALIQNNIIQESNLGGISIVNSSRVRTTGNIINNTTTFGYRESSGSNFCTYENNYNFGNVLDISTVGANSQINIINTKADDANVVHRTGTETVANNITFTGTNTFGEAVRLRKISPGSNVKLLLNDDRTARSTEIIWDNKNTANVGGVRFSEVTDADGQIAGNRMRASYGRVYSTTGVLQASHQFTIQDFDTYDGTSTWTTRIGLIADRVQVTGNLGIFTATPTQALHVNGNVRFSGALMSNNLPGTTGQVLTSAGAGVAPAWTTVSGGVSGTSSNGLTTASNNTTLGGALTTPTTITTGVTNTLTLSGLQAGSNTDDVVTNVAGVLRSTPIATLIGASTASNGLTRTGINTTLGGTLSTPTTIATDATNTFTLSGLQTGSNTDDVVTNVAGVLRSTPIATLIGASTASNGLTRTGINTTLGGTLIVPTTITTGVTNTLTLSGLQTGSNTDDVVTNVSGVLRTTPIATLLSASTASNGLTRTGINTTLGGTLIVPTTITTGVTNTLTLSGLQTGSNTDAVVTNVSGVLRTTPLATLLSSAVTSLGAVSATPTTNGGAITSGVLNLAVANDSSSGLLSTASQTIGGQKSFAFGATFFGAGTINNALPFVSIGDLATAANVYIDSRSATLSNVNLVLRPKGTGFVTAGVGVIGTSSNLALVQQVSVNSATTPVEFNALVTGSTPIYTVPTGRRLSITGIIVKVSGVPVGVNTLVPSIVFGSNPANYDNQLTNTSLTGAVTQATEFFIPTTGARQTHAAGAIMHVRVVTAATGNTTLNYTIEIIGVEK